MLCVLLLVRNLLSINFAGSYNMVSKADQVKYGIWNSMHEYRFTVHEIAVFTGYPESEVQEFFDR